MSRNYSKDIVHTINNYLTDNDWNFDFDEKYGVFNFNLLVDSKIRKIQFVINVTNDDFILYGILPINADVENSEETKEMMEFIVRANYEMRRGCFEMDYRDGEIRYRIYVDCDEQLPSSNVIGNSIYYTYGAIKKYAVGIVDILFLGANAKESMNKCKELLKEEVLDIFNSFNESKDTDDNESINKLIELLSELDIDNDEELEELELLEEAEESEEDTDAKIKIKSDLFNRKGGKHNGCNDENF